MTALLLALALAQAPAGYTPQEAQALFTEANDAYYRQDYKQAAEKYERLVKAGLSGPDVLFNLGTTHLAAGALGPAVVSLERARALSRDDDIEANLAMARQKQGDQVVGAAEAEGPFLQRVAEALDERLVTVAFLACWYLTFLMLLVFRRALPGQRLGKGLALAALLLASVALGGGVAVQAWVQRTVAEAVVQSGTAKVREFPGENARVAFEIHAGLKVRVMEESGRYVRIRLPNALEGWTEKEGLETL
jgi:tetratricopeptide (TPR) repeat protein